MNIQDCFVRVVSLTVVDSRINVLTSILAGLGLSVADNLLADQVKVGIFDARLVQELAPLLGFLLVVLGFGLGLRYCFGSQASTVRVGCKRRDRPEKSILRGDESHECICSSPDDCPMLLPFSPRFDYPRVQSCCSTWQCREHCPHLPLSLSAASPFKVAEGRLMS